MQKKFKNKDWSLAYLMILPIFGLLTVFVIVPFGYAAVVSFLDWSFYQKSIFVGFANYLAVLRDPYFYKSIRVGLQFSLYVVPVGLVLAFLTAHIIKQLKGRTASFVKTAIYIPTIMSGIIASIIFAFIYDFQGGLANYILGWFGGEKQAWLNDVKFALPGIAVPAIWLGFGITTLIMLAGLLDIPESYYEAADLEGAGTFTKMTKITIPLMKNVIVYLLVTGFIAAIQQLDLALVMTKGGPVYETQTPNLYIFNHFLNDVLMGRSIASALLLCLVLGTVSAIIFRLINSERAGES